MLHSLRSPRVRAWAAAMALPALPLWCAAAGAPPEERTRRDLERGFAHSVRPFVRTYCLSCHGPARPQAQLDLSADADLAAVTRNLPHWALSGERLASGEMPPSGAKQPSARQRAAIAGWLRALRQYEARRNAGDPGPVLARRLSNAEYDYTLRDLTGVDLRPARAFPLDPANQEGFDNTGESLTLSPALTKKYYEAARAVADNLALTSTGLAFAPHPVLAETDRDKFCVLRIVDFYRHQPTDLADYFRAAWRYRHRAALGAPEATLATIARSEKVSPKYLERVWRTLNAPDQTAGPIATLQAKWNALPGPTPGSVPDCAPLRDWVNGLRRKIAWRFPNLTVPPEFSTGSQCNILWKDRQYAAHRRRFDPRKLQVGGSDPDLALPQDEIARAPYLASFTEFASVFPDAFYIDERGLMEQDAIWAREGRLLTAGSHNAMGYFRDDTPLMELVLDEKGVQELETLWRDFSIVAAYQERMHLQFFFYERNEARTILTERDPEFNFARTEDRTNLQEDRIERFARLYLAKAKRKGGSAETLAVFDEHFRIVNQNIRAAERDRLAAEPVHRNALLAFAERAFRRPLAAAEKAELRGFYRRLRAKEGLTHEDAIRDSVVRILMSPHFLFRMDPAAGKAPRPAQRTVPLSDFALASRLSYFLWSSMPDDELFAHAAKGDLHRPEVLLAQTRRMLKDPKTRALAVEFGGNWLDFRRFEEHNAVDRERFPRFDDALRQAMFEEPVRFLLDMFQNDRPALELLYGEHTFVNAALARHYGMTDVRIADDGWVRVDDARKYGRGGLLPMAVFLTQNASGLRTSPVKRGYWVVRRVLGERIPPPPPTVPELPRDEEKMERPLREMLARHRSDPACAGCHARFDSYGLVFEGFGPVGERRTRDLGGKPVDTRAPFPGGVEKTGVEGLRELLRERRQKDFADNFCRKLLSYGLGRTLLLSDEPTLTALRQRLTTGSGRVGALLDTIVTSRQFRMRRAPID